MPRVKQTIGTIEGHINVFGMKMNIETVQHILFYQFDAHKISNNKNKIV